MYLEEVRPDLKRIDRKKANTSNAIYDTSGLADGT